MRGRFGEREENRSRRDLEKERKTEVGERESKVKREKFRKREREFLEKCFDDLPFSWIGFLY